MPADFCWLLLFQGTELKIHSLTHSLNSTQLNSLNSLNSLTHSLRRGTSCSDLLFQGTELKIHSVSHRTIPAGEVSEVTFLTSKIVKKNTALKITDPSPTAWGPDDGQGWVLEDSCPTYTLDAGNGELYIHHQCTGRAGSRVAKPNDRDRSI